MAYVLLFIFPKWMLAKTVQTMKQIFHEKTRAPKVDLLPWYQALGSHTLPGSPHAQPQKQQEPWHSLRCSTLTSAAHGLPPMAVQRRRKCFSASAQGQGIWAASAPCKLPSGPALMSYTSDHGQLHWASALAPSQHSSGPELLCPPAPKPCST